MRRFQVILFVLGAASFIVAAFFSGTATGETLWKAGMAVMVGDIVCIKLWPPPKGA